MPHHVATRIVDETLTPCLGIGKWLQLDPCTLGSPTLALHSSKRKLFVVVFLFGALGVSFHKGLDYLERCLATSSNEEGSGLVG